MIVYEVRGKDGGFYVGEDLTFAKSVQEFYNAQGTETDLTRMNVPVTKESVIALITGEGGFALEYHRWCIKTKRWIR